MTDGRERSESAVRDAALSLGPREPDAFVLHKSRCGYAVEAVCGVWAVDGGWRLAVVISDAGVRWTATAATHDQRRAIADAWRMALVERGWA